MKIELSVRDQNDGTGDKNLVVSATIEEGDSVTLGSQTVEEFSARDLGSLPFAAEELDEDSELEDEEEVLEVEDEDGLDGSAAEEADLAFLHDDPEADEEDEDSAPLE